LLFFLVESLGYLLDGGSHILDGVWISFWVGVFEPDRHGEALTLAADFP
jgi:hypothetical protein